LAGLAIPPTNLEKSSRLLQLRDEDLNTGVRFCRTADSSLDRTLTFQQHLSTQSIPKLKMGLLAGWLINLEQHPQRVASR